MSIFTHNTKKRVLLGFSGGIDSTAAAIMLREKGYEVHLVTLDTTGSSELLDKANRGATQLNMPLQILDVKDRFRQEIIDYFIDGYRRGETPAPCTRCNPQIKWDTLYHLAQQQGFDHIATGHYFRIHRSEGIYYVRKAIDPIKDQSYYLWGVPQACLAMALTPMGDQIKSEIKTQYSSSPQKEAHRESMGICFLQGEDYRTFLHHELPTIGTGEIVDRQGHVVGTHTGYTHYTIGQKRGLNTTLHGVAVIAIDPVHNRLVVGDSASLYYHTLILREWHSPSLQQLFTSESLQIVIRGIGRNPNGTAHIYPHPSAVALNSMESSIAKESYHDPATISPTRLRIELDSPAWAPAKGQPVVIYHGDLVLGGGILDEYYP